MGLRKQMSLLQFVVVVERSVEGRRSQLKRVLNRAPHYSGALASLGMRLERLKHFLPKFRDMLAT